MHPIRQKTRRPAGWMLTMLFMLLAATPATAQDKAMKPAAPPAAGAPEVLMESGTPPERAGEGAKGEALSTKPPAQPKVSLFIRQYSMQNALDELRQQTGITFEARGKATEPKIDLSVDEIPLDEVLDRIAKPNNLVWVQISPTLYRIYDQETYKTEVISKQTIRKSIQLHYINATELDGVIKPMLQEGIESSTADARTNRLIVQALPDKMSIIQDIVNEFDVQLYSMVFEIQNADTEEIGNRLHEIASESAEIQVDPVNRVIVVKDTFERIKQMESLVAVLDRDQEIMVYNLNNLGLDGELIDDIVKKFVEPVITKDALVDYQPKLGRLVVRDVHTAHKKIQEILKALDTPRKQVLIEGELLSVDLSDSLNFGMNWTLANDLKIASENTQSDITIPTYPTDKSGLPAATLSSSGLNILAMSKNVRALLSAALSASDTRILMRPRLLIASGEEGNVSIGENQPVLNTYYNNNYSNTSSTYYGSSSGQMLVNTGLDITIRPIITNRGLIEMYVRFENSTPIIVADIGNGVRGVGSNEQSADTYMLMPDGETRVIGGLISQNKSKTNAGMPYLSKIPYAGWLFGKTTSDNSLKNLMFFLTATVIQEKPTNEDFVEPVNAAARAAVAEAAATGQAAAAPAEIHKIPPELLPYLQSIRPEALPFKGTVATTATVSRVQVTSETTKAAVPGVGLLSDQPYVAPPTGETTMRVGGAVPSTTGGSLSTKAFGTAKTTPTAKATPTAATTPVKATATPRPRITPRGAGVPYSRSTPSPRVTPTVTAAPTPASTASSSSAGQ